mmetsp:Transcript_33263/g.83973  ORF Transcript_33263/g.83973 Transcript_33263/m.83973 type:complete len:291 (-) Transcript_33263:391-1263(-)
MIDLVSRRPPLGRQRRRLGRRGTQRRPPPHEQPGHVEHRLLVLAGPAGRRGHEHVERLGLGPRLRVVRLRLGVLLPRGHRLVPHLRRARRAVKRALGVVLEHQQRVSCLGRGGQGARRMLLVDLRGGQGRELAVERRSQHLGQRRVEGRRLHRRADGRLVYGQRVGAEGGDLADGAALGAAAGGRGPHPVGRSRRGLAVNLRVRHGQTAGPGGRSFGAERRDGEAADGRVQGQGWGGGTRGREVMLRLQLGSSRGRDGAERWHAVDRRGEGPGGFGHGEEHGRRVPGLDR